MARSSDVQVFIRKSVFEHVAEMKPAEIKLAFQIPSIKLIPHLFKGIKDQEVSVFAIQALIKISQRLKVNTDSEQLKALEKAFNEQMNGLMEMALPTPENLAKRTSAPAIQLLQCMADFFPEALAE